MNSYNIIVYIRSTQLVSRYQHWNEENSDEFCVAMVSMLKGNNDDDKQIAIFMNTFVNSRQCVASCVLY